MSAPLPESTPPATVAPVVLWRGDRDWVESEPSPYGEGYHPYRAIPVAAYAALMARIERAEAALAFYARTDIWTFGEDMDGNTWAYADGGAKARSALGREGAS